jgi:hypothetical protein
VVFLLQISRILSLSSNILSNLIPLLTSEALMILFKNYEIVGLRVHEHLRGRVLEIEYLVSELLAQSLDRDDADGVARDRNDALGALLRAERTRLLQVLIGEGGYMHLTH